jgi:hypothetical protein
MRYIFFELGIFLQFPILLAAAIFQLFALMGLPIHFFLMYETKRRTYATKRKKYEILLFKGGRGTPDVPTYRVLIMYLFFTVFRIRILGSVPPIDPIRITYPDPAPDPALFVSELQDAKKFFAYYSLKVHLHHSSQIKSHKEVTKICTCLMMGGSGCV